MISSNVCQQLVDEPTHQSSRGVDSSYELRDHLGEKNRYVEHTENLVSMTLPWGGGEEGCTKETLLW